jgi:hypothetical protein
MYGGRFKTILIDRGNHGSTSATTSMLQYEIDVPLYQLIDLIGKKLPLKATGRAINRLMI